MVSSKASNGGWRDELLNETMFRNHSTRAGRHLPPGPPTNNTERPHSALDYQTPADYAQTLTTAIGPAPLREMKAPQRRAIAQPAPTA